jgi:autotransporter-associated beta strand protein
VLGAGGAGGDGGGDAGGAGGAGPNAPGQPGLEGTGGGGAGAASGPGGGGTGGAGGRLGGGGGGTGGLLGGAGGEFGGGGGPGGDGGFGGGGGGGTASVAPGEGGFGAGDGGAPGDGGDGGSGFGGAVFVQEGGQLEITDSDFGGGLANSVAAGLAGTPAASDGLARGQDLYLHEQVTVVVDVSDGENAMFFGSIGGEGGLEKVNLGSLHLLAPNDYEGGTEVMRGELIGAAGALQGDIEVAADATLVFQQPAAGQFEGAISGAGEVVKIGVGKLTLTGSTNTWSGPLRIRAGSVAGDTASLPGDVVFESAAPTTLFFEQATDATHSGDISGTQGSVVKQGAGRLILAGDNSWDGTTVVEQGILQGDSDSLPGIGNTQILAGAELSFDQAQDGAFAGATSGAGLLSKQGAGELTLSGVLGHTGGTLVRSGRLDLTGTLTNAGSTVSVLSGGELGGTGTVSQDLVSVAGGGRLAPGPRVGFGTLTLDDVVFQPNAVFALKADTNAAGVSDRLDAASAALGAASVSVELTPGVLSVADSPRVYTILTSTSPIVGSFAPAPVEDLAFLDGVIVQGANQVTLEVSRNAEDFESIAATANQAAVGAALAEQGEPPYPPGNEDLEQVYENLFPLTLDEMRAALDLISGEGISAFPTALLANSDAFTRTLLERLTIVGGRELGGAGTVDPRVAWQLPGGAPAALLAAALAPGVAAAPASERSRFGVWLDGYGVFGGVDGDSGSADTEWVTGGASGGFDVRLSDHALLGIAGGYGHVDVDVDERLFAGSADVFQGAVYGAWVGERGYVGALGRYAFDDFEYDRRVVFGEIDHATSADFDGSEFGAAVETGVVAFAPAGVQIEPMASFAWSRLERDDFREQGSAPGSSVDLVVESDELDSLLATVGLRVHKRFRVGDASPWVLAPELWARWAHQFGDRARPLDAALSGAITGGDFQVSGASMARDGALLGLGWSVTRSEYLSFFLNYDLGWNPDLLTQAVSAGLLIRW